jgi:hypothetical protein
MVTPGSPAAWAVTRPVRPDEAVGAAARWRERGRGTDPDRACGLDDGRGRAPDRARAPDGGRGPTMTVATPSTVCPRSRKRTATVWVPGVVNAMTVSGPAVWREKAPCPARSQANPVAPGAAALTARRTGVPTVGRVGTATRWTATGFAVAVVDGAGLAGAVVDGAELAGAVMDGAEFAGAAVDATPVESAPPVEVAWATEAGTAARAAQQAAAMVKRPGGARI